MTSRRGIWMTILTLMALWIPSSVMAQSFHKAAQLGNKRMVERYIANNYDVDARNNQGDTPLILAVKNGHTDVAKLLLNNKADVNAKNHAGQTALYWAKAKRNRDLERLLKYKGAK